MIVRLPSGSKPEGAGSSQWGQTARAARRAVVAISDTPGCSAGELLAGFKPPKPRMSFAGAIGALLAIALISGIFITLSGATAAFQSAVAAVTVCRPTGKYLRNIGGCEFCLFWAICCCVAKCST